MEAKNSKRKQSLIYDPLYGFIELTQLEWEIIHTPFYQRLRWIKQIGFSCYTFHGAEHSRFGHSIGVMFNAHKILKSIGKAVKDEQLFNISFNSSEKTYHQSIRLAALLHDLGTFCFSHTTEMAYIRYGETTNTKGSKGHPDDHEHLGSWIIKNTKMENGITYTLEKHGISAQTISDLVKGVDPNVLANQILHAEVDCDRMDYLLRDAHYTGLNYGNYDRDYLLHHFTVVNQAGHEVLAIKQNALHCVEDFLTSRVAWYTQVVRSSRGAKYDALAEELTFFLLEKGLIYSYSELLDMAKNDPVKFYSFNDQYFMGLLHNVYYSGKLDAYPREKDICHSLLFEASPKTIRSIEFNQRILNQDDKVQIDKVKKQALEKVEQIKKIISTKGSPKDWIVVDIPAKDVKFVKSKKQIIKSQATPNLFLERDPVKILKNDGSLSLLVDMENSTVARLQNHINFIPNVFCSQSAYDLLTKEGII
ncbi:MAG: HD domain-containing protein [Bacteriovoracaceae bacterium]|jgi:HD superfamily phosphohydrolase|nr:HD domain-containing protein [Bacteriovoracaceae bacterium]